MADNAEHLEAIFLKDNLSKTDVVDLLAGHRIILHRGYGDSSAYSLITGKQLDKSKAKDIIERWRSLRGIWESSTHNKSRIEFQMDSAHDDLMAPRNYVIRWAREKHKGTNKLFEGFRECIEYALKQTWITPRDWELVEEAPKEPEPVKDTLLNPETVIYALKDMLNDADLIDTMHKRVHQTMKRKAWNTQDQLVNYLADKHKDKPQKGLSKSKLQKAFAKANKKWKEIERN